MADKGESKFSGLLFITSIIIFFLFISVIVLAYLMKFNFTYKELKSDFSSADAISLQITLLGIILTALALGGGIVAFIGWKGLQKTAQETAEKTAKDTVEKTVQETAEKTAKDTVEKIVQATVEDKINNNVVPEIEKIVKDVLDKINFSSKDKTDEEKYFKK